MGLEFESLRPHHSNYLHFKKLLITTQFLMLLFFKL